MQTQTEKIITPAEFVQEFKEEFKNKFGVFPTVLYNLGLLKVDINFLLDSVNLVLSNNCPGLYEKGIRDRRRHQTLAEHRQIFFKIARDMGYSYSYLSSFVGYDHSTAIYSVRKVEQMLKMNDRIAVEIYQQVKDIIYGKESIQNIGGESVEPESTLSSL